MLATTSRTAPAPVELAAISVASPAVSQASSVKTNTGPAHASATNQSGMIIVPTTVTVVPTNVSSIPSPPPPTGPTGPMFDGRPIRKRCTLQMLVTAYSPDTRSCGPFAHGITASGYSVWTNAMHLVAADTRLLPFGSIITIPGYHGDKPVPVLDRGGKIKGNHIDLLFPTNEQAVAWGAKRLTVTVWEYAD